MKERHVFVIPGLGDDNPFLQWEINQWKKYGLHPQIHSAPWIGDEPYKPKFERLDSKIHDLSQKSGEISLVGISAGGSLAFNTYCQNRELISKLVLICAPLRKSSKRSLLIYLTSHNPSFHKSLLLAEKNLAVLQEKDRKKILVIHGFFDEQVPTATTFLPGVQSIKIPSIEHNLTLTLALTLYKKPIIDFLI